MSVAEAPVSNIQRLGERMPDLLARVRARPLELVRPVEDVDPKLKAIVPSLLPWQQPLWALVTGRLPWRSTWGPKPSRPPRTIVVVCANQVGKSTIQGACFGAHLTARTSRWPWPGEAWGGMPTIADATATMRSHVARWLGDDDEPVWTPREGNTPAEAYLKTRQGWRARIKSFEAGATRWESATLQAAYLDEPCPDDVLNAVRERLQRHEGLLLCTFTALQGVQSTLYGETWEPWQAYRKDHPGARWGEVDTKAGAWVFSVGKLENAVSRGGYLPDEAIAEDRAKLEAQGRVLEARVRYDGEWLDISEDRIIPVEKFVDWSNDPKGGWADTVMWVDIANSAKAKSCETGMALVSRSWDGNFYVRESIGGRWDVEERMRRAVEMCIGAGSPHVYVQRVPGDTEWGRAFDAEMERKGSHGRVIPYPEEGPILDKVTRAMSFSEHVVRSLVHVRPEHRQLRKEAATATRKTLKDGKDCDVLDACMGAVMVLAERNGGDVPQLEEERRRREDEWDRNDDRPSLDEGGAWSGYGSEVE